MIKIEEVITHTKKLSILFIEDYKESRDITTDMLESIFQTVTSCKDGQEALDAYINYHKKYDKFYDIVLSDIEMPLMNGIELTQNIYKIHPSQLVIIISAFDDVKYLLKLINLGIEQFILKPINSQLLLQSFFNASKKIIATNIHKNSSKKIMFTKDIGYNLSTKSINNANENIYLTKFEIIFIELLISSFGKIYSNEDVVSHFLLSGKDIDASNIRKLVSKLRKKIPKNSLESIYGIGYKFIRNNHSPDSSPIIPRTSSSSKKILN
ncbi:MAG: transcriptional regulator [Sulfurimonas sp.]|nr:MAG: transcriptional regulator [Sulfurimonas sp.]